jgi:hypothetical protein
MTCIVWHKNKLYADSLVYKDGEQYHSLTKIQGIVNPFAIKCGREGFVFDDIVHGWSGTGAYMPMLKFVESLENDAKENEKDYSDHTVLFYGIAAEKDLVVAMGNLFEVLLIGEKFNHSFRFDTDGFIYRKYEKGDIVTMGSGCHMVMNYMRAAETGEKVDVLRAMFQTFIHDHASGGFIDIWEMTTHEDKKPIFQRVGLHHEIPRDLIQSVLDKVYPNKRRIHPTFQRPDTWMRALLNLDEENKRVTAELAAAKKLLSRYRKKLGIREPRAKKAVPAQQ